MSVSYSIITNVAATTIMLLRREMRDVSFVPSAKPKASSWWWGSSSSDVLDGMGLTEEQRNYLQDLCDYSSTDAVTPTARAAHAVKYKVVMANDVSVQLGVADAERHACTDARTNARTRV